MGRVLAGCWQGVGAGLEQGLNGGWRGGRQKVSGRWERGGHKAGQSRAPAGGTQG